MKPADDTFMWRSYFAAFAPREDVADSVEVSRLVFLLRAAEMVSLLAASIWTVDSHGQSIGLLQQKQDTCALFFFLCVI